jgi:hypothetical protein
MAKAKRDDLMAAMTEAHTDLVVFESIIAILEGGTVSARVQPYDFKVIALCKKAQQQSLKQFDRAREALRFGDRNDKQRKD